MSSGALITIGSLGLGLFVFLLNRGVSIGVNLRFKAKLAEIENAKSKSLAEIDTHQKLLAEMRAEFDQSHVRGRQWLVRLISEAIAARDEQIARGLERKSRPAYKAAEELRKIKAEKKDVAIRARHFEYLLQALYEEFPILGDYEEDILSGEASLNLDVDDDPNADLVAKFVSKEDYNSLRPVERNQLALDRWLLRRKSTVEIGRMYERYVGSQYETRGWEVEYHGATRGLEDLGRDLICKKGTNIRIVQAKYWANHKTIHEKHVFQLYGTTFLFRRGAGQDKIVEGYLYCTCQISPVAREAADALDIKVIERPMKTDYPMIKCNVNGGSRIYHLPFDQQYDRVKIVLSDECYVATTAEAEAKGFRRAKRWVG